MGEANAEPTMRTRGHAAASQRRGVDSMGEATWSVTMSFLPAEGVAEAKSVSKMFRSAARTCLTRGRFKNHARLARVARAWTQETVISDADRACFRLAWTLEPGLAAAEVAAPEVAGEAEAFFFDLVEPSLDGLERIISSMEHAADTGFFEFSIWDWARGDARLGNPWLGPGGDRIEPPAPEAQQDAIEIDRLATRVWNAVEHWRDPKRAFAAVYSLESEHIDATDHEEFAREKTAGWTDQAKREAVLAAFAEVDQEMQEQFDADYEAEHGWKYCAHGEKFWDCPECGQDRDSDRDDSE